MTSPQSETPSEHTPAPSSFAPPKLWNPTSAILWSLLFSPAFGAYLQMKNWQALNNTSEANASKIWFYLSLTLTIFGSLVPSSEFPISYNLLFSSIYFGIWIYTSAQHQRVYVNYHYAQRYAHKPWTKVLTVSFIALAFLLIVNVLIENGFQYQ